jgi:tetratricopeptide (TPR) repeat protein
MGTGGLNDGPPVPGRTNKRRTIPIALLLPILLSSVSRTPCCRLAWIMLLTGAIGTTYCPAQNGGKPSRAGNEFQLQYDAAQRAQASGDLALATHSYQSFLSSTLQRMAEERTRVGDYPDASKLFEEMLDVAPADTEGNLHIAYANAALLSHDLSKAKSLAETVLANHPKNAEARLVLGECLLQTDENEEARKQLEAAVALDSTYKNGLALATAYLALADTRSAARLFTEMLTGFGEKATYHLDFGRAYAEAGFPEQAITEFNQALAKDPVLPTAHYCLGASYLLSQGELGFARAKEQFRRELELHPNDYFSLSQLGFIALSEHRMSEAEADLKRASALDPRNPDNPLLLGQVYVQTNQLPEAATAFRQAIALTTDLSRNHYQVQRAHYLLGRLLLQTGHGDEGRHEMQLSADLLKQNKVRDQVRLRGVAMGDGTSPASLPNSKDSAPTDIKAKQTIEAFTTRLSPALADSYNNLGVIAAGGNEYATATRYFEKAAQWNPTLEGLDFNWGRAAFAADLYTQAVGPLSRYLALHPQERGPRQVLGVSFYHLKDYLSVVHTLQPVESEIASSIQLGFIYAQALVLTGDEAQAIPFLQRMLQTNQSVPEIHRLLGEAYAHHKNYGQATDELRVALQLNPADTEAKDQLALVQQQKGVGVQP